MKNLAVAFAVAMLVVRGLKCDGELTGRHNFNRGDVAAWPVFGFVGSF